jgi:hypothetical protein
MIAAWIMFLVMSRIIFRATTRERSLVPRDADGHPQDAHVIHSGDDVRSASVTVK